MSDAIIEAFELARFAEQLSARLAEAHRQLPEGVDHRRERGWLETAEEMVNADVEPVRPLLARARLLPELSFLRDEVAEEFQNAWVDGLEKLVAGITFHAGSRAPVLEALFPARTKLPALRRANRAAATAFSTEFERRLKGSYVTRMFGQEDFAFVQPVVEAIQSAFSQYVAIFEGTALSDDEVAQLRSALTEAGQRIDRSTQQAKLLAQAALLPVDGAFENAGLSLKPRKRKVAAAEALAPAIEAEPELELEAETPAEAPLPVEEEPVVEAQPEAAPEVVPDAPKPAKRTRAKKAASEPAEAGGEPAAEVPESGEPAERPPRSRKPPKGPQAEA